MIMPKHKRKAGGWAKWRQNPTENLSDFTINDFANSRINKGSRLKKSLSNAIVREASEVAWYDRDLEDIDEELQNLDVLDDSDIENETNRRIGTKRRKKKPITDVEAAVEEDEGGNEYPLDVWFLLSEYVRPEDVRTFACICRGAHYAVKSPKFWLRLYKRYYKPTIRVPEKLTPECIVRPHSLKACVVRALFFVYPPFMERIRTSTPFENEPHGLVPSYCILAWHRNRNVWDFHFKFKNGSCNGSKTGRASKRPDLLDMLEDVEANEERGCRVLQVTCQNFVSAPAVMGMYLTAVNLNVGYKMHHRLRLTFSNNAHYHKTRDQNESNVTITFDPVSNIRVLDWWHPQYPHK